MIEALSNPSIQAFIKENLNKDVSQIALKYKEIEGVPIQTIVRQIQGKQKAKNKLPSLYASESVIFPPSLNLEQSSSESTADFKAKLIRGKTIVDLTGGFGVDTAAFAKVFDNVFYVERNEELFKLVEYNFKVLGLENVRFLNTEAEQYLSVIDKVDCIYIDPARRDKENQKVFRFEDCEPNVPSLLNLLLKKAEKVLVKASPILDLKAGLKELEYVTKVYVVAVANECKEVLFLIEAGERVSPKIITVNLSSDQEQEFSFFIEEENNGISELSSPLKYLYEPNAAILKAGAFNSISKHFNLFKLHKNSHLYTKDTLIQDFPGRKFEILFTSKYDKKEVGKAVGSTQANVTVRNFYDSVDKVRKKLGLKEGGDKYIFATTDYHNKPIILVTRKVN